MSKIYINDFGVPEADFSIRIDINDEFLIPDENDRFFNPGLNWVGEGSTNITLNAGKADVENLLGDAQINLPKANFIDIYDELNYKVDFSITNAAGNVWVYFNNREVYTNYIDTSANVSFEFTADDHNGDISIKMDVSFTIDNFSLDYIDYMDLIEMGDIELGNDADEDLIVFPERSSITLRPKSHYNARAKYFMTLLRTHNPSLKILNPDSTIYFEAFPEKDTIELDLIDHTVFFSILGFIDRLDTDVSKSSNTTSISKLIDIIKELIGSDLTKHTYNVVNDFYVKDTSSNVYHIDDLYVKDHVFFIDDASNPFLKNREILNCILASTLSYITLGPNQQIYIMPLIYQNNGYVELKRADCISLNLSFVDLITTDFNIYAVEGNAATWDNWLNDSAYYSNRDSEVRLFLMWVGATIAAQTNYTSDGEIVGLDNVFKYWYGNSAGTTRILVNQPNYTGSDGTPFISGTFNIVETISKLSEIYGTAKRLIDVEVPGVDYLPNQFFKVEGFEQIYRVKKMSINLIDNTTKITLIESIG